MEMNRVIRKPHFTEKSLVDASKGSYTFVVDTNANKKEIARAVEKAFGVDVLTVRTRISKGKRVRVRGTSRENQGEKTKKANVTIAGGQKIPVFEAGK
jgi:large subunit ribosomal protein L23